MAPFNYCSYKPLVYRNIITYEHFGQIVSPPDDNYLVT